MSEISATLKALVSSQSPSVPKASAALASRAAKPKAKPTEGSVPGTPVPRGGAASELPTFDPALARVARESGLPAHELSEIRALLSRRHSSLENSAKPLPPELFERAAAGVESEDEWALEAEQPVPASQPIEAAVVALTKIVSELAGKKLLGSCARQGRRVRTFCRRGSLEFLCWPFQSCSPPLAEGDSRSGSFFDLWSCRTPSRRRLAPASPWHLLAGRESFRSGLA